MSVKDAYEAAGRAQHYADQRSQLNTIDRNMVNDLDDYSHTEKSRNNLFKMMGNTSLLAGTVGKNLTNWNKMREYAHDQGLESGGFWDTINPFKEDGFGERFSRKDKPDAPAFTIQDLGNIHNLEQWSKIYMPKDTLDFDAASKVSMADNPLLSLMQFYDAKFNKDTRSFNEKMNAGAPSANQSVHPLSHLDATGRGRMPR